jgi:hypothetical protein
VSATETPAEMAEDPQGNKMINSSNPREVVLSTQAARLWASMAAHGDPNANPILPGGGCEAELARLCARSRAASHGDCLLCAESGANAVKLQRAGCGSNGVDAFCGGGGGSGGGRNQSAAGAAAGAAGAAAGAAAAGAAAGAVEAVVAVAETWPAFTRNENPATMVFGYTDPPGQVQRRYRFDKCNFWDEQFAKLIPHQASSPDGEW